MNNLAWLILTNGVMAVVLATLSLADCQTEAKRINADWHYAEVTAFCQRIDETMEPFWTVSVQ